MLNYVQQIDQMIVDLASIYERADRRGAELAKDAGKILTRLRVHLSALTDSAARREESVSTHPAPQAASGAATLHEIVLFPAPATANSTELPRPPTL